jgi:hypothetical protein
MARNRERTQPASRVEEANETFHDAVHRPARSSRGNTVTVACKMPHGMLLRLFVFEDHNELVLGGGMKTIKRAVQVGEMVRLNGYAVPHGQERITPVAGGFGLTVVDAEFMEKWMEDNQDLDAVKNGLIFVHESNEMAVGQAKEYKGLRNGLEPLDPDTKKNGRFVDPRIPQKVEKLNKEEA